MPTEAGHWTVKDVALHLLDDELGWLSPSAESFAETGYARRRRWKPGHFSFNTREGQCPTCCGLGHIDLDVQYLPDITVGCPTCHGARFSDATLAVQVDGLTIADVLGLSVREALERFDIPAADGSVAPVAASRKAGIPASQA
jgi:excinuclease ABC subunit A